MERSASPVQQLAGTRVLFGHQSVGENLIAGVRDVLASEPGAAWPIMDPAAAGYALGGFLTHEHVGRNGDPRSKTKAFAALVAGSLGSRLDVAFHKYCYADIDASTEVAALFSDYRQMMAALAKERPRVMLAHVTVPLVRVRTGPKAWVQRALGRTSPRVADNAKREAFNELLRREYARSLFDLAAAESVGTPRALRADFTDDGGHLNEAGRREIARGLLQFLGRLVDSRQRPLAAREGAVLR